MSYRMEVLRSFAAHGDKQADLAREASKAAKKQTGIYADAVADFLLEQFDGRILNPQDLESRNVLLLQRNELDDSFAVLAIRTDFTYTVNGNGKVQDLRSGVWLVTTDENGQIQKLSRRGERTLLPEGTSDPEYGVITVLA